MITIRYWAAARAASGVAQEQCPAGTLAEVLERARARHGERLDRVLARCSYLVDGDPVGTRAPGLVRVPDGAVLEVLPPFAGG